LGFQNWSYTPTFRGFDEFYGYYGGSIGYNSKLKSTRDLIDLHEFESVVTNATEIGTHLTTLLQNKAESFIDTHSAEYASQPLFMYYAPQNMHTGSDVDFEAPLEYVNRCADPGAGLEDERTYCALLIMIDEAIGNLACKLDELTRDTLLVVASDNGGLSQVIAGSNYPYRGAKGSLTQGGVKNTAFIHGPSSIIPASARGTTFSGLVHVTDWAPTFIGLATAGAWNGVLRNGFELDGIDVFSAMTTGGLSPRTEILHNYDPGPPARTAIQILMIKLINGSVSDISTPNHTFVSNGSLPDMVCDTSQLLDEVPSVAPNFVPSFAPTPAPSTPLPTPVPTFLPTLTPVPSNLPIPAPWYLPSPVPSNLPSPVPSALPIPTPSASPTSVSKANISISINLALAGGCANYSMALQVAVEAQLLVVGNISDATVTFASHDCSMTVVNRRLSVSVVASAVMTIKVSSVDDTAGSEYALVIASAIAVALNSSTDMIAFSEAVSETSGIIVEVTSVAASATAPTTAQPSVSPARIPSEVPTPKSDSEHNGNKESIILWLFLAAALLLLAILAAVSFKYHQKVKQISKTTTVSMPVPASGSVVSHGRHSEDVIKLKV
jgi:hypothetical protein